MILIMARQSKKITEEKKSTAKVVSMHRDDDEYDEKQTILQQAEAAEKNGDLELAEKLYKQEINCRKEIETLLIFLVQFLLYYFGVYKIGDAVIFIKLNNIFCCKPAHSVSRFYCSRTNMR